MDLQELSEWMKERNLKGHWEHSEWSQTVKPFLWKGDEIMQALNWSGELITTGEAGRRTIQMRNPGLSAGMTGQYLRQPRGHKIVHRQAIGKDFRLGASPRLGQRKELGSDAEDGGIGLRNRRSKQLAIEGYGARKIRHRDHHVVVTPHSDGQSGWLGRDGR